MSGARSLLTDLAEGLFADLRGRDFAAGWPKLAEAGFASLLIGEEEGGFGGDWGDLFAVMRLAGYHALPLPLGETIVAHWLLRQSGIAPPEGPLTLIADGNRAPWGRHASAIVRVEGGQVQLFTGEDCQWEEGASPSGEPRDRALRLGDPTGAAPCDVDLYAIGAFLRVAQAAGALDAALALSIDHANTRVQFGKPLAKLQAVQQNLASLAAEAAAVNIAGQAAAAALDHSDAGFEIAAAKVRTNIAIGIGVAIAHQVHGAIGYTQDYALHSLTSRLMGWRSEYGNDMFWSIKLGRGVAQSSGAGLWHEMTARSDRLLADRFLVQQ